MPESIPQSIVAGCISCRRSAIPLFRWKLQLWEDAPAEMFWLCQQCRDVPNDQLIRRINLNLEQLPILEDEPPIAPSRGRRNLRLVGGTDAR